MAIRDKETEYLHVTEDVPMSNQFIHGYALLIGIGEPAYQGWSLPVTVKDVQALRAILTNPNLCAYPDNDQHIRLLHDAGATRNAILAGLDWLKTQATADPEATIVVYFSGHGWLDRSTGQYYLIPHDITPFDIPGTALRALIFNNALRQIPAQRLLVFIDSCHAAGMATAKDALVLRVPSGFAQTALPKGLADDLKRGEGRAVFTSSREEEKSWVRPDGTMSIYTCHLIEALQGAGNQPGDKVVRVSNLMNYLGKTVPESARKLCYAEQTPFFDTAAEDFPIAVLLAGKGLPGGGWEEVQHDASTTIDRIVQSFGRHGVAIGDMRDQARVVQAEFHGEVRDSAVAVAGGDVHITQGLPTSQIHDLFKPILAQVQARPDDPNVGRDEIAETVKRLRDETERGERANPNKIERWLESLAKMAPDIWGVVVKILQNPIAGIAEVVRKVAARAREERTGQARE